MACLRKRTSKVFTPEELYELMPMLKGERADAVRIGEEHGMNEESVDRIRYLLGYSKETVGYKLTKEQRDELIDDYRINHMNTGELAKKYDLTISGVIFILKHSGFYDGDTRRYSDMKIRWLKLYRQQGKSYTEIAKIMGKTKSAIASMCARMRQKGEL